MPPRYHLLLWLAAAAAATAACGSSSYNGTVYEDREARYDIGAPGDDWRRLDVAANNDLAWVHDGLSAIVQVNSSCDPELDIPLIALTNHLLIGFTERDIQSQELVPMDAREALRTHVVARLDGVPRELLLTVIKKDGCVYDFALIAPPGAAFSRAQGTYDGLLASFHAGDPAP